MTHDDDEAGARRGPLDGVRVLDLTSVVMGPMATQMLGDLGADVITIEKGEPKGARVMGVGKHPQFSDIALNLHRNKRNVSIDIKNPEGYEVLIKLVATSDVFVTNLRPAVLRRARLSYEDLRQVRPDIIFCQAHGYPSESPEADEPAFDEVVQAASGVSEAVRQTTGVPGLFPTIMIDKICAMTIVYAVNAALFRRERDGVGEHIEVPMIDVARSFMLVEHGSGGITEGGTGGVGYKRLLSPHRRPQRTRDGWISMYAYLPVHYDRLFAANAPELVGDVRYSSNRLRLQHSDFLYEQVARVLTSKTTDEWLSFAKANGIPASAVVSFEELVADLPHVEHPVVGTYRHIPFPVRFANASTGLRRPAPMIGADTRAVLGELGIDSGTMDQLMATGAVSGPEDPPEA